MIKIELSREVKIELEKKHSEWYSKKILKKIREEYEKIRCEANYTLFLKKILEKGKDFSILENEGMKEFIDEYNSIVESTLGEKIKFEKILKKIFNYGNFSRKNNEIWSRHKMMTTIDISVCPYCQRQYITKYESKLELEEKKLTTGSLDHFYSQSEYPFLALSLYNFIPSCSICNSIMKTSKETYNNEAKQENIIYPYKDDFKGKFTTGTKLLENLLSTKEVKVKIETEDLKSENTVEMFKLNEVYETTHNKYLINMLDNIKNKPTAYLESIAELFSTGKESEKAKESEKEKIKDKLRELVLEPYKFKSNNGEPLGKLTKDILEEFGIEI